MTIFKHTLPKVMSGRKTQTSRLFKEGERLFTVGDTITVYSDKGRPKWQTGKTYAIQPEYGTKQVGRYRCLHLAKRDVRDFTQEDAEREGFDSLYEFWLVWTEMHDKVAEDVMEKNGNWVTDTGIARGQSYLKFRPDKFYRAWVIRFEVVKS